MRFLAWCAIAALVFATAGCSTPTPGASPSTSPTLKVSATPTPTTLSPDEAKKQLQAKGLAFDEKTLADCAEKGMTAEVELFLAAEMPVDAAYQHQTPLMRAAKKWQLETVEVLLAHDANVNYVPEKGNYRNQNILYAATTAIDLGPNMFRMKEDEKQARLTAAEAIVRKLLEKGAKVETERTYLDDGPLHRAATYGSAELIELLISKGGDVNRKNLWEDVPLTKAIETGNVAAVEVLLAQGADPKILSKNGQTIIFDGVDSQDNLDQVRECMALVIAKGVDVNKKDKKGNTALSMVKKSSISEKRKKDMIDFLKSKGAK